MQKPSPKTHVIVGDHAPEPRVEHEPLYYGQSRRTRLSRPEEIALTRARGSLDDMR